MNWWKELKGKVSLNEPLKSHTSFRIGGKTAFFIQPKDIADLKVLLNLLKRYKIRFLVIGKGSNLLASDKRIKAAVISLNSPYFRKLSFSNDYLQAGSAVLLNKAIVAASKKGLGGLEFLTGIPGTIGGALVMNAGVSGKSRNQKVKFKNIASLVKDVTVMDINGKVKTLRKRNIRFGYRYSNLSKYLILGARLKLMKKSRKMIKEEIAGYLGLRRATQDLHWASAGCIFKNPPGYSAGRLVDLCGLKEKRIGGACISGKHANFILNRGNARCSDVLKLMRLMQKKVKNRFGIELNPEIKIWQ